MRPKNILLLYAVLAVICSLNSTTEAQEVILDSLYADSNWTELVISDFGGTEVHEQRLTGGNPGAYRYMRHTLPLPPGPQDLTRIEVYHTFIDATILLLDEIASIDYKEDIRLLNLPWPDAFVTSSPIIMKDFYRIYVANEFISVIGDTAWHSEEITGLTANDFTAIDGSGDHPDLSFGFVDFGFLRVHTRGQTLPPINPGEDLVYEHASDNFTVTVHYTPPENNAPIARVDEFVYLDYFVNSSNTYPVLANDSDPDGDSIWIIEVGEPTTGTIVDFTHSTVTYQLDQNGVPGVNFTQFGYMISDGEDTSSAFVIIDFCVCPVECLPGSFFGTVAGGRPESPANRSDSLNIELFRQLRDGYLLTDSTGISLVNYYYEYAPELIPLLLFDRPDIGAQAFRTLQLMQGPLVSLLDGDGMEVIAQDLIDSVEIFMDTLLANVSDTLAASIEAELAKFCPFQDMVGLPVAEAAENVFCDSMATSQLDVYRSVKGINMIRPNPFSSATQIDYQLRRGKSDAQIVILDQFGTVVKRFSFSAFSHGATHSVIWNGTDASGSNLPAGLYYVQLIGGRLVDTRKVILLR